MKQKLGLAAEAMPYISSLALYRPTDIPDVGTSECQPLEYELRVR